MTILKKHIRLDASNPSEAIPHELGGPIKVTRIVATTNSEAPVTLQVMDGGEIEGVQHFVTQDSPLDWNIGRTLPWDSDSPSNIATDLVVSAGGLPSGTGVIFIDLEYGVG